MNKVDSEWFKLGYQIPTMVCQKYDIDIPESISRTIFEEIREYICNDCIFKNDGLDD